MDKGMNIDRKNYCARSVNNKRVYKSLDLYFLISVVCIMGFKSTDQHLLEKVYSPEVSFLDMCFLCLQKFAPDERLFRAPGILSSQRLQDGKIRSKCPPVISCTEACGTLNFFTRTIKKTFEETKEPQQHPGLH